MDVTPTLLDLIGTGPAPGAQGISMKPLIDGAASLVSLPRYEVIETEFQGTEKIAVYGKRFKYIENRVPQEGVPARELQPRGGHENGSLTNVMLKYPEVTSSLKDYLDQWETRVPKRSPTAQARKMTPEQIEQLKSIGYLAQ